MHSPLAHAQQSASDGELVKLETSIVGGWGHITNNGAASISDTNLKTAVSACKRYARNSRIEYSDDALKEIPKPPARTGNVVYYKTDAGLQRLDTSLRKVVLISKKQLKTVRGNHVWTLGTKNGSINVAFAVLNRNRIKASVMIEGRGLFLKCPKHK